MLENTVVTKSNNLIEARYKLTLDEQRLILYLVSLIQPLDEDFKEYTVTVKDFMSLVDIKGKGIYKQFIDISESLTSKTITIKKEKSTLVMSWLSSAEYFHNQGRIKLSFDPKLKPYLLNLKNNFTTYKLENVIKLKSVYSIRIYELLKQYQRLQERTFTLEQLRDYLCIESEKYPLYANFKQKVLRVAEKELREKCDIYFTYEEIKQGRAVTALKFKIHKSYEEEIRSENKNGNAGQTLEIRLPQQSAAEPLNDNENLVREIREFITDNLADNDIMTLLKAANYDVEKIKNRYEIAKKQAKIENLVGWMVSALKKPDDDFSNVGSKKENPFINFPQRKWDYEEIERFERQHVIDYIEKNRL